MLVKCHECEKLISSEASNCPGCGAPNKRKVEPQAGMSKGTIIALWVVGVPVVLLGVLGVVGATLSPEDNARLNEKDLIALCDKQADRTGNPDLCQQLREHYLRKYGIDY